MQVDQIHYGSANRQRMKGYQIIGKSAGVDSAMAAAFCKWAPSHNSLEPLSDQEQEEAWGLSYFPLSETHVAIARSVHGGPEYSGRGGLAVVTSALLLTRKQFAEFDFHPIDFARTAIPLGYLLLPREQKEKLPPATMVSKPFNLPLPKSDFCDSSEPVLPSHVVNWIARESCSLLRDDKKVMVVGPCDPLPILTLLQDELSPEERFATSFACGIKPSSRRDFRLQFTYETMSTKLEKELERSGIESIDLARVLLETR